ELVREQNDVPFALHDLERVRHIRRARNARHIALGFRVRCGPPRAILVSLRERLRLVGNRSADDDALPGRYRAEGAELPEGLYRLGGMPFEIPVSGVERLPNAVQVRLAGD